MKKVTPLKKADPTAINILEMPATLTNGDGHQRGPVVKRQKLRNGTSFKAATSVQASRIFAPFRTLGLVSPTGVPFTSVPLGKTTFQITTSVGRCLQTYDLRRGLNLVFLSRPQTPEIITATAAWKDRLFAAWGGNEADSSTGVWVFKRGKKIDELAVPAGSKEAVKQVLIFGSWIVGCCLTKIEVWKSTTYEHYTTLTPLNSQYGKAGNHLTGGICNMPTFLNKIFAGREDGSVDIWNLSTGNGPLVIQDVRKDKTVLQLNFGSSRRAPISSISFRTDGLGAGDDGRAPGVMATSGYGNGDVTFWDLNKGGRVMGVLRGAHSPPSLLHGPAGGGMSKIEFLAGQPVLMSSGLDNSLKSWIFDETPYSPIPRILHSRSGHASPVTQLEFLSAEADGADISGKWLLSAGKDRSLWGWSLRRDGQSTELSQGNIRKKARKLGILGNNVGSMEPSAGLDDLKAPEITCIASSLNRDGGMGASVGGGAIWTNAAGKKGAKGASESGTTGWESVVTGHKGDKAARTWFWGRKKAGRWAFETGDASEVTVCIPCDLNHAALIQKITTLRRLVQSVAMTPCGTFALLGSANGGIDMFNLQSGIHRQRFPSRLTPAQARKLQTQRGADNVAILDRHHAKRKFGLGEGKHTKAVTGVMVDGLNRTVISCSLDGRIKFWDFSTGILLDEVDYHPMIGINGSRYYRPSDLIALSCDDLSIRVVDTETKKLVRELWGCIGQIIDFCFSNDGRWIVAASSDSVVRVWDLPTGHLIDALRLESPCTALAFSNTGEFLATAHEEGVGINIWNNKTIFTHVPTRQISEKEIANINPPTASGEGGQGPIDAAFDDEGQEESDPQGTITSLDQLSQDIMTLSVVPKSRWQTLLHLDLIKQRNKPKEPPKAPEKAPFFLPSLENAKQASSSSSAQLTTTEPTPLSTAAERSRITKMDRGSSESPFTTLLRSGSQTGDYTPFLTHFSTLPPPQTDTSIRTLSPPHELLHFVQALTLRLRQRRDYELVQAWMAVFLRLHGEAIVEGADTGDDDDDDDDGQAEILREALREWRAEQEKEGGRLGVLGGYCSGVLAFLRSAR
ncbi:MAG: hypothetical protein M1827_005997 [Pycnora praestabilis]|nr:MAG: hypothetical protein M1827_005997 [Pycnora praestabilis]